MRMGLEAFKAEIVKRVGQAAAAAVARRAAFIFINADGSDLKLAEDLRREFKNANLIAAIPVLQGSSEDVRLDLEENIVECDALVMVYGETTPVWVRGQLRLYSKLKHRRKQPLKALALYVGPPESKPDIGMDLPEIKQIDYRDGTAAESLRQFLAGQPSMSGPGGVCPIRGCAPSPARRPTSSSAAKAASTTWSTGWRRRASSPCSAPRAAASPRWSRPACSTRSRSGS